MRKIIIDTDTGSDDAVAILMALRDPSVQVLALTTVCGNVSLEQATINALRSVKEARTYAPPVYKGAYHPLVRTTRNATQAHGDDGMSGLGTLPEGMQAETEHAVEAMLRLVKENPGEVEIVAIGPATNVALAMMKDPETMKQVKHIYSMGSGGFGPGNVTSVAEFNVFVDAEAYKIMVEFPVPVTIVGFDICRAEGACFSEAEMTEMKKDGPVSKFAMDCTAALVDYNELKHGKREIDLADPFAMGAALWPDTVAVAPACCCLVCAETGMTYGQVVVSENRYAGADAEKLGDWAVNATVVKRMDNALFKKKLRETLKTQ